MKQNQKGFTLIELLAVIVILAIIALIATPMVLNAVEDARQKAAEASAYGVVEAVKRAFSQAQLDTNAPTSVTVDFADNKTLTIGETNKKVAINGNKPESGTVSIDENGKVKVEKLKFGKYYCGGEDTVTCTTNPDGETTSD